MTYISVEGWPKLLMIHTDANEDMWLQPSAEDKPSVLVHTYTLNELLKEWQPFPHRRKH